MSQNSITISQPPAAASSGTGTLPPASAVVPLLRLVLMGDTGATTGGLAGGINSPLARLLARWNPDQVILPGDCRYEGYTYQQALSFLGNLRPKTLACPGNHDLDSDNGAAFYAAFPRVFPSALPGCYVQTMGNLLDVIVLNDGLKSQGSQIISGGIAQGSPLQNWFDDQCTRLSAPYRMVVVHHPLFSVSSAPWETLPQLDWITDPRYRVNILLNGHTHLSMVGAHRNTLILNASATAKKDKRIGSYLVGSIDGAAVTWADTENYAACLLSVTPTGFTYEFWDQNEILIHSGGQSPAVTTETWDQDVVAPLTQVANGTHYITHAPAAYYLDAVRWSIYSTHQAAELDLTLYVDDDIVLQSKISTGSKRFPSSLNLRNRLILPGQRISVRVVQRSPYASPLPPPQGLRLAQIVRRITA